jgi:TRAP-type C4-dicarboxylate transport system permease small subunit
MLSLFSYLEDILNYVSLAVIAFLMFLTTGEVIGRYVFNNPIPGHHEMVELCVPAIVFLGMSHLQRLKGNIYIDVVMDKFEKRHRYALECLIFGMGFVIFFLIMIATFRNSMQAYSMGEVTETLLIPVWPFRFLVPLGSLFLCLRFIVQFSENITTIAKSGK